MKTYLVGGTYVATQKHAQALAKQRGCDWSRHDVPTDSEGLIRYLNALRGAGQFAQARAERDAEEASRLSPETQERIAAGREKFIGDGDHAFAEVITLTDVETFIQGANHAQVSSIFENCVYRGRELAKGQA